MKIKNHKGHEGGQRIGYHKQRPAFLLPFVSFVVKFFLGFVTKGPEPAGSGVEPGNSGLELIKTDLELDNSDSDLIKTDLELINSDLELIKTDLELINSDLELDNSDLELDNSDLELTSSILALTGSGPGPVFYKREKNHKRTFGSSAQRTQRRAAERLSQAAARFPSSLRAF